MGNHLVNTRDSKLFEDDTQVGKYVRHFVSNQKDNDLRLVGTPEYNVNVKRACCLGALSYEGTRHFIEFPLSYFGDNDERCILRYEEVIEGNTVKYKEGTNTRFTIEYDDINDKKAYKFYRWTNNTKEENPQFQKVKKGTDLIYSYFSSGGDKIDRYLERVVKDDNGNDITIYKAYEKGVEKYPLTRKLVDHLENKDSPLSVYSCLKRQNVLVDIKAPGENHKTKEETKSYCNSTKNNLSGIANSYAPPGKRSDGAEILMPNDCPNFMSYYCGKLLKDQQCVKKVETKVRSSSGAVIKVAKGEYNFGNPFCVDSAQTQTSSYNTQLYDCKCINSGAGPNLNNNNDPRKFNDNNIFRETFLKDGKINSINDPYNLLNINDISNLSQAKEKLMLDREDLSQLAYSSMYAINVNQQPFAKQNPWDSDASCRTAVDIAATSTGIPPFIPNEPRKTASVTICSASMDFNNLDVGGNANIVGNNLVNMCGAGAGAAEGMAAAMEALSKATGSDTAAADATKQIKAQESKTKMEQDFTQFGTNATSAANQSNAISVSDTIETNNANLVILIESNKTLKGAKEFIILDKDSYSNLKINPLLADDNFINTDLDYDNMVSTYDTTINLIKEKIKILTDKNIELGKEEDNNVASILNPDKDKILEEAGLPDNAPDAAAEAAKVVAANTPPPTTAPPTTPPPTTPPPTTPPPTTPPPTTPPPTTPPPITPPVVPLADEPAKTQLIKGIDNTYVYIGSGALIFILILIILVVLLM